MHRLLSMRVALLVTSLLAVPAGGRLVIAQQPQATEADAIVGDWRPADMNVDVRVFAANGQYLAGIVRAENKDLVNKEMMRGITYDAATHTWKGEVFAFKRGQFVPMTIRLTPGGFEMVAGSGIMSKTIEWVRVQ